MGDPMILAMGQELSQLAEERGIVVRDLRPEDRPQVDRVIEYGVLRGRVAYETKCADRIRRQCDSPRERFFVAEAGGKVIGTVAVVEGSPDVGHLHWMRVDPEWQGDYVVARLLARAAASHAREVGLLKLIIHAPADMQETLKSFYHELGFEFSRRKEEDGMNVLEFYLNLYERPERVRKK